MTETNLKNWTKVNPDQNKFSKNVELAPIF